MKKIYYLIAMAVMAFTFTSCEDVPEPFGQPINPNSGADAGTADPAGSGTATDPYNVAGILDYTKSLGADVTSPNDVYFTGIITEVGEAFGTQYGNATFRIGDTEKSKSTFYCYRCMYIGNVKYTDDKATNIKVGDKVVVCGKVVNYKGSTPETSANAAYVVSINGTGGGDTPSPTPSGDAKGTGTQADPFNVAAAIAKCKATGETATTESYYIKGIADAEYTVGSYKNVEIDIVDQEGSSDKFKVFRVKDKDGKGIKEGYKISKGATIIVYGPVVNFKGNTPETATGAYLVSVNGNAPEVEGGEGGGGSDTPSGEGDGTEAKPYNVAGVVAAGSGTDVFVKAYIVGWVEGQALATGAHFDANATVASNILIADSPNETDVAKCIPIQLPSGAVRTAVNLKDNAGNYKKEILLVGNIEKYFGTTGIKSTSYAKIGDTEAGTKPSSGEGGGGSDTPSSGTGTLANPLTASQVYDIVAAMESGVTSTEDYYVKGKICSIKFEYSAQYGTATFNISDDGNTGSKEFIAYSTYYHASEQKWKEGDTQVAVGDEVVICGKVVNYNGNTPEFASKKSYVVSISK